MACSEELGGVDEKIRFQRRRQTKLPDSSDRFDQLREGNETANLREGAIAQFERRPRDFLLYFAAAVIRRYQVELDIQARL